MALTFYRVVFLIHYSAMFLDDSFRDFILAFLVGLRFDVATLCLLLVPGWIVTHVLSLVSTKRFFSVKMITALLPFVIVLPLPFIDFLYYGESGRRLSYEIFQLAHDMNSVTKMVFSYGGPVLLYLTTLAIFTGVLLKVWGKILSSDSKMHLSLPARVGWVLLEICLLIIGIRGGLQSKPLRPSFAYLSGKASTAQLSLNPIYTVFYALKKGGISIPRVVPDDIALATAQELLRAPGMSFTEKQYPLFQTPDHPASTKNKNRNIVFMILEGWPAKYVGALNNGQGVTPHFDQLASKGMLFTRFYAIGHRSTDGITAGVCSLPTYSDLQIIGTALEQNKFRCAGEVLGDADYSSFFLHGAKTGSFGLNAFARVAGFDRYLGKENFNLKSNEADDTWGVYDHVALARLNDELKNAKTPVFALWFSLTTHSPYQLPSEKYKVTPATVPDHDFIDTLRYSDEALGNFFREAAKESYFPNTVFVLMADHTNGEILKGTTERQRIPFLLYSPGRIAPQQIQEVRSQLDVFPTLVDLAGVNSSFAVFGRSLMDQTRKSGFAFADLGGHYAWFQNHSLLLARPDGDIMGLYDVQRDLYQSHNLAPSSPDITTPLKTNLFSFVQVSKKLTQDNRLIPNQPR